jgi:hypothetical protein
MTNNERDMVQKLMEKSISNEDFKRDFTVNVAQNIGYIKELLEIAYTEKNSDDVEYLLFVGFMFNLFTQEYVDVLCNLIEAPWHQQHENIAMIFQSLKSPKTTEALYKTALTEYEYLDYDESYALAVKCIWALGGINTDESREKLKLLTQSENEIIRDNAVEQLNK